jgi:ribosomal protein S18 acetylase RimI-like enzyme
MSGNPLDMNIVNVSKNFIIRPFQLSDQEAAKHLVLAGLAERFNPFKSELNTDVNDIAKNFNVFLVAYVEDELVATGGLKFETQTSAKVVRMSTARAYRQRGIAKAILRELESIAKARGISRLTLVTNKDWSEAVSFYQRYGFRILENYVDDTGFQGVRFEKSLSDSPRRQYGR